MRFSRKGCQDQFANSNMDVVRGRGDIDSGNFLLSTLLVLKTRQQVQIEAANTKPRSPNQDITTVSALPEMEF